MIVGHFLGKQALAAVGGTTGTLINLLVGFFRRPFQWCDSCYFTALRSQ